MYTNDARELLRVGLLQNEQRSIVYLGAYNYELMHASMPYNT